MATALLFYGRVEVLGNKVVLRELLRACGPDAVLAFLEMGVLQFVFEEALSGIHTNAGPQRPARHWPVTFQLAHGSRLQEAQDVVPSVFQEVVGRAGKGRRLARRFLALARTTRPDDGLVVGTVDLLKDPAFAHALATESLAYYVPHYLHGREIVFRIHQEDNALLVETNIDFEELNSTFRPPPGREDVTITPAFLLSYGLTVHEIVTAAANANAEIHTDALISTLLRRRVLEVVDRRAGSSKSIGMFQDFVLDDARAIGQALKRGDRTMTEFVELLKKSRKFRDWIAGVPPDVDLIKEYHRASVSGSWAERLPRRLARWVFFTGLGLAADALGAGGIGTMAGIAIGAGDTFVVDKLIGGWSPHQFVAGPLTGFAKPGG